jgi:hypothetical protein
MTTPYPLAGQLAEAANVSPTAWVAFTFANSWSNIGGGVVTAQMRLLPLTNEVEMLGGIAHASVSGTSLFSATLGAAYLPASQQSRCLEKVVAASATYYAATTVGPFVVIPTTGAIQFQDLPAGTTQVEFAFTYSLDA